jgi:hypothetical protein
MIFSADINCFISLWSLVEVPAVQTCAEGSGDENLHSKEILFLFLTVLTGL